jgi:hypothetical protein
VSELHLDKSAVKLYEVLYPAAAVR